MKVKVEILLNLDPNILYNKNKLKKELFEKLYVCIEDSQVVIYNNTITDVKIVCED